MSKVKNTRVNRSALNTADKALLVLMGLSFLTLSTCGVAVSWLSV